ncbi:hypothetical protein EYZ11_012569 [Aspergillus tanneri]|uniref:Uncharacterized protein n=1 Tax=Aspergillus tanneri TaxID=1220188 RepID=A0A4S3J221_9EURO|nr:hypothetical protein EYZ11_012569 [Aspergillus tanneri]
MTIPLFYHTQAQSTFKLPLIANENAYLGDIDSSPEKPISAVSKKAPRLSTSTFTMS